MWRENTKRCQLSNEREWALICVSEDDAEWLARDRVLGTCLCRSMIEISRADGRKVWVDAMR